MTATEAFITGLGIGYFTGAALALILYGWLREPPVLVIGPPSQGKE